MTSINAGCSDKSKMEQLPCVKLEEPHEDKKTCENLNVGRLNENTAIKNRPDLLSSVGRIILKLYPLQCKILFCCFTITF